VSSDLAPHALAPGTQILDYTIVSVIGTGGFSIVYKAIDNSLDRAVAIKEYFPGAFAIRDSEGSVRPHSRDSAMFSKGIESFLNEGKLLAAFDHPALVRVYRCWEERGTAYLAMRLYTGTTLRDAVKAGDWHTDEATLAALLLPMCNALDLLHASNCYHRDVAPDNIMLVDGGAPVLLDFGAARKAIESTQVFTAILKPGYAPIEQYGDGELKQGPWTDIYALAGVVYFTLAGNAPPTAISRMLKDAMPRPRDAFVGRLPERWLDAIEIALSVKPELRPQTMAEFVALFGWESVVEGMTAVVLPTVQLSPPPARSPAPAVAPDAQPTELVDDSTVVIPRRAVDAQIAAKNPAQTPVPVPQPEQQRAPEAQAEFHPEKPRTAIWIAAVATLFAMAALVWKLTLPPTVTVAPTKAPTTADTKAPELPVKPAKDTSADKKTSLPTEAAPKPVIVAPDAVVAPPVATKATTAPTTVPIKTAVTEKPSSSASEAKANANAKEGAKESAKERVRASKAAASTPDDGDDASPAPTRSSRRPERCDLLIERFQLGESISAADQRFIKESCK
jgi:serine/threonine protein kinase